LKVCEKSPYHARFAVRPEAHDASPYRVWRGAVIGCQTRRLGPANFRVRRPIRAEQWCNTVAIATPG